MDFSSVQKARRVLDVAQYFATRSGGILLIAQIHARSTKAGWGTAYINEGIRYAVNQKWLETTPEGTFRLTIKGFGEYTPQSKLRS